MENNRTKLVGRRKLIALSGWLVSLLLFTGCNRSNGPITIGTFPMGERVQAGDLSYNVLEANWKSEIEGGRTPTNRYLFVRVTITNDGKIPVAVAPFTLQGPGGKTYQEVSEGVGSVDGWLGLLRDLPPGKTEQGWAIFDAPMGAYKLVAADNGEIGSERFAHIEIPVHLE